MHAKATSTPAPGDDELVRGDVKTQPLPLVAGTYTRGQVLGTVAGGIGALDETADAANAAKAMAICPVDMELTEATEFSVYVAGEYNQDKVDVGAQDLTEVKIALSQRGIYIREWGAA